jgi:hypothetical protein
MAIPRTEKKSAKKQIMDAETQEYYKRHFPGVGDIVMIEVRKNLKDFVIIRNFGVEHLNEDEDSRALFLELEEEAKEIAEWLKPDFNILALDIFGSTAPSIPIAPCVKNVIILSQEKGNGALDILDIVDTNGRGFGTGRNSWYFSEVRESLQSGLDYYYLIAVVVAIVNSPQSFSD